MIRFYLYTSSNRTRKERYVVLSVVNIVANLCLTKVNGLLHFLSLSTIVSLICVTINVQAINTVHMLKTN